VVVELAVERVLQIQELVELVEVELEDLVVDVVHQEQ
jgi:hypothetical protein